VSPSSSLSSSASSSISSSVSSSASPSPSPGYEDYTRGEYIALPANDNNLTTNYSVQDYLDVDTVNNVWVSQDASGGSYTIHEFKNFTGELSACTLECVSQTTLLPSSSTVYLQIYNVNTTTWDTVDSDNSSPVDTNFTLTAYIADLTNYKDGSGIITCRTWQKSI
jgi:hypothetical protein